MYISMLFNLIKTLIYQLILVFFKCLFTFMVRGSSLWWIRKKDYENGLVVKWQLRKMADSKINLIIIITWLVVLFQFLRQLLNYHLLESLFGFVPSKHRCHFSFHCHLYLYFFILNYICFVYLNYYINFNIYFLFI